MTELQTYKIASIPADGVGKEVIAAGRKVLDFVAEQSNGKFAFQWDDSTGAASTTPGPAG